MNRRVANVILGCLFLVWPALGMAQEAGRTPLGRSVIRISYIPGNLALPLLVGIEHGVFASETLFLSPVPVTEEGALMRSLNQGGTDFAIGSQSLLLSSAENKIGTKVVAIAGYGRESEMIGPVGDTTTKGVADIKGKTVLLLNGVHNFDAVPELYRAMALSKPPMRISDVKIEFMDLVNLNQLLDPKFKPIYTQRKVGGVFVLREFTTPYVDQKKARVVLSNEQVGSLLGRGGAQGLFASNLVLAREPGTVERFVRAWARTMQYISDPANKEAIVRVLQIYYLRQYGTLLRKDLAELFFSLTKYDRVAWTDQDVAEITINGKALNAARNVLFVRIKEADKRPFKDLPDLKAFIDMSFATKALAALEAEKKAAASKPPAAATPPAKDGDKPRDAPPATAEKPKEAAPEKKLARHRAGETPNLSSGDLDGGAADPLRGAACFCACALKIPDDNYSLQMRTRRPGSWFAHPEARGPPRPRTGRP